MQEKLCRTTDDVHWQGPKNYNQTLGKWEDTLYVVSNNNWLCRILDYDIAI